MHGRWKWSAALLAAVLAAGGTLWWTWTSHDAVCGACQRPIHSHSRTTGLLDGKPASFCCPVCAFTEQRQTGKQVRVTALTDYDTGASLHPANAVLVRNSDVNPCMDGKGHFSADKQPLHTHFDRCSPSVLAFASQGSAAAFVRSHGGSIARFRDVEAAVRDHTPP